MRFYFRTCLIGLVIPGCLNSLHGQSTVVGSIAGVVRAEGGQGLYEANVILIEVATGRARLTSTDRDGRFRFALLPSGEYSITAEHLGFRPKEVTGVAVRPGRELEARVELAPAPPPVTSIDTTLFDASALFTSRAGVSQWFSDYALRGVPDAQRSLTDLLRLSTRADPTFQTQGLPGRASGLVLDGVRFDPARHPALPTDPETFAAFPLSAFGSADLLLNDGDVEWSGFSGALLHAAPRGGTGKLTVRAFGDFSGDVATTSRHFDISQVSSTATRGGLVVSGPIVRDTANFVIGAEVQLVEAPQPPAWEMRGLDEMLAAETEARGVDLEPYLRARVVKSEIVTSFARLDWQVASQHLLSLRGNFASVSVTNPVLGPGRTSSLGATIDGTDLSTAATLTSQLVPSVAQELRLGIDVSSRDYAGPALPETRLVEAGLAFGADPALPASVERVSARVTETLHVDAGAHRFKLGGGVAFSSFDDTYASGRNGSYTFGGLQSFQSLQGAFVQAVGGLPNATYSVLQLSGFLQDTWRTAPGLDVTFGARFDVEQLPVDDIRLNEAWMMSTGLENTNVDRKRVKASPRFNFVWNVGALNQWAVRGSAGIYYDLVDPNVLNDLLTNDGQVAVRRAVGDVATWPAVPDSMVAPVLGSRLTLLGPDFEAPRSARLSLGIGRVLGSGTAFHLSGTYRHTDFLPRRADLNLLTGPVAADQYGRPIYGSLEQHGSLIVATPGSNRLVPEFDLVSALNPDGYSDYWGVTAVLERQVSSLVSFSASYTFSRTEDNWLAGTPAAPESQLTPFPDSLMALDWADGRSDLDAPHRLSIGARMRAPGRLGFLLAVLYRFRSGRPFTPGFRTGVDLNGDGSGDNDPAFIDDQFPGVDALLAGWPCLRDQRGFFAARNSCRGPGLHWLDVRVGVDLVQFGSGALQLVVDGLNLLDADDPLRDRAVFLVDPGQPLDVDGVTGQVTVPLLVNERFGEPLVRYAAGRVLRIGLRVSN